MAGETLDPGALKIARSASKMSTCSRTKVGAIFVLGPNFSIGWNEEKGGMYCPQDCPRSTSGLPSGAPFTGAGSCISRHAEMSAIANFEESFHQEVRGGEMVVTHKPCEDCQKRLDELQITVQWEQEYGPTI